MKIVYILVIAMAASMVHWNSTHEWRFIPIDSRPTLEDAKKCHSEYRVTNSKLIRDESYQDAMISALRVREECWNAGAQWYRLAFIGYWSEYEQELRECWNHQPDEYQNRADWIVEYCGGLADWEYDGYWPFDYGSKSDAEEEEFRGWLHRVVNEDKTLYKRIDELARLERCEKLKTQDCPKKN